jgi:hypothetical protein
MKVASALAILGLPVLAAAQDTEWNRYTLQDLGGVFVSFEVNEVCESVGVTAAAFEADVSLKLIESDVGVLTQSEMLSNPAMPELRISLDCADGSNGNSGTVGWSVGLRVQQAAQMLRDTQITLPESVTWFATDIGVASAGGTADAVGASLMTHIERFAEAWAEINAEEDEGGAG